ncbi:MAG: hypothetical protein LC115_03130 [Bacteroidia bacterium]|nr:hypothetical protein [Bacteroidia bacterium]
MLNIKTGIIGLFIGSSLMFGCKSDPGKTTGEATQDTLALKFDTGMLQNVGDIIKTVPSPVEIATLVKKSGANFNAKMLNPAQNAAKYTKTYKQGLNMGVYGADLGYAALYSQTQESRSLLEAVNKLGTALNILGAFELETIKGVEANLDKPDSLIQLVTEQFKMADAHLKQTDRADIGILVMAGGWVEGLYLSTQLIKAKSNPAIETRVGEQKVSLGSLIALVETYKDKEGFVDLAKDLNDLKASFDKVTISYEEAAPNTKKSGDTAELTINTKSKVEISKEVMAEITKKIEAFRNKIVS